MHRDDPEEPPTADDGRKHLCTGAVTYRETRWRCEFVQQDVVLHDRSQLTFDEEKCLTGTWVDRCHAEERLNTREASLGDNRKLPLVVRNPNRDPAGPQFGAKIVGDNVEGRRVQVLRLLNALV